MAQSWLITIRLVCACAWAIDAENKPTQLAAVLAGGWGANGTAAQGDGLVEQIFARFDQKLQTGGYTRTIRHLISTRGFSFS
jgi:hypothetical protein